ncbi:MAG: serine hydrolase domain-containing protein [Pirellulales bacterium]
MNPDSPMDLDSFQKAWQAQSSQTRVTIAADLLRNEVQRSERNLRDTIFRRDFREVAIGLVMLPVWFYLGRKFALPASWYLAVPAITWVILFILVDRFRHGLRRSQSGQPLVDSVRASLGQVEHQVWLLRNVFWWYLLPFSIAILAFFVQVAWLRNTGFWPVTLDLAPLVLFLLVLYGFIYWLNQRAVRHHLEPRRRELLTLLATLGDESASTELTVDPMLAIDQERPSNPGIWRQVFLVTILTALLMVPMFLAGRALQSFVRPPLVSNRGTPASFAQLNSELRREKDLVGLAALVTIDGKVVASAVDGQRKSQSGVPLELSDQWHLGGITASITATMIARLIESGELQWTTTVGECFPDAAIHEDWKNVTFDELFTHTSGAPPIFSDAVHARHPPLGPECTRERRAAVLDVLANKPDHPPGTTFAYSNVGYTIAAAMAEAKTGVSWEDLVQREVFDPLALASAGFGPPNSPDDTLPQPRGHHLYLGVKLPADDDEDNTPIMGPAGSVHMTLADLVAYASEHLRGQLGHGRLLSAETYQRLHTPRLDDYACGWGILENSRIAPLKIYWHNGANTMWYALVVFVPERNMVVAVTSNDGDLTTAEAAAWELVKAALGDFTSTGFAKKSPFAAVRWNDFQPEVRVDGEWFQLLALDDIPAAEIVAFSRKTYDDKWQKRFEEDLVELLTRMDHPPGDKVTLVVQTVTSPPQSRTLKNVPLTEENRRAIRDAAQSRFSP